MKFFGIASAFIATLVTLSSAAPTPFANDSDEKFYITAPLENDVYSAGDIITAKWLNGVPGSFTLELLKGNNAASMQDTGTPFKNTDGRTGSYNWQVPSDTPAGIYAFHYVFNNGESYSPRFKITTDNTGGDIQQQHTEATQPRVSSDTTENTGSNTQQQHTGATQPRVSSDTTGNTGSNTQQQHTEATQPRVSSDTTSNGPKTLPKIGTTIPSSSNPNGTPNTHDQSSPQAAAGRSYTTGSSPNLSETSDRVPHQQISQQRPSSRVPHQQISQQRPSDRVPHQQISQ